MRGALWTSIVPFNPCTLEAERAFCLLLVELCTSIARIRNFEPDCPPAPGALVTVLAPRCLKREALDNAGRNSVKVAHRVSSSRVHGMNILLGVQPGTTLNRTSVAVKPPDFAAVGNVDQKYVQAAFRAFDEGPVVVHVGSPAHSRELLSYDPEVVARAGLIQTLAAAESQEAAIAAWRRYTHDNVLDVACVRTEVANSWQRCRDLNMDPYRCERELCNSAELRERLYKNQNLVKVARPFMENLRNFMEGSGFQVVLSDETGFLLEVFGDPDIVSKTRLLQLCPGGNWNESVKGTNAIGTAIVERKPVQIYAWEHYCQPNHVLTCSASPIFDPEGVLVGILDMTGDYRVANSHTLGMVVAAVNAIENQLRLQKASNKLYMAYRYSTVLLESMSDGLISTDNNGIVTEINARAGEIFGVSPAAARGRHISEIAPSQPIVSTALASGADHESRELIVENTGRKVSASTSLLRDELGGVIGAVAVIREIRARREAPNLQAPEPHLYGFEDVIGDGPAMRALKQWAKQAATCLSTVLICGETGTGKELLAQAIHSTGARSDHPFIALNCASLPENLIESELFGYEEGSFTGAKKGGAPGKFEMANGGTLFLDEVGDMPLAAQAKLLRAIQEKRTCRIGSAFERPVDVRIIAATNKDLRIEVERGNFRLDLYYRLNVLEMRIPPLRERIEDIPLLVKHLVQKIAERLNRPVPPVDDAFVREMRSRTWPGNIRELENTIERSIIRAGEDGILTADAPGPQTRGAVMFAPEGGLREAERAVQKEMIAETLALSGGNIQKAARKLGICRNTLYRRMKEFGIS